MPQSEGFGQAGNPRGEVLTIQGAPGMTPVAISGSGSGGASQADDSAFTPNTDGINPVGGLVDDAGTDTVQEGRVGAARITPQRAWHVNLRAADGSEVVLLPVTVAPDSGVLYQGAVARTVARAAISASSSGDNTLLAAQGAGNKIRVLSLFLVAAGTVGVRFESGAGGTALTGVMPFVANTGMALPHNPDGWFETAGNALLNLELSDAVLVAGAFTYAVVT